MKEFVLENLIGASIAITTDIN